jgi:hypothetical protein
MEIYSKDLRIRAVDAVERGIPRREGKDLSPGDLHREETAHPGHPRRGGAAVGATGGQRRRYPRAPLPTVGEKDGRQGIHLGHEPSHTRESGVELQKKTLGATERDEAARSAFRERLRGVDAERIVFVDESSTNVSLTPRYARAPKDQRAFWEGTEGLRQARNPHLVDQAFGDGAVDEHRGFI